MADRARLTITDVVFILVALAGLAAFYPVFDALLSDLAPHLEPGEELVFGTLLPVALVVMLAVIYVEARRGM